MEAYTDVKLLDVSGALDVLPKLSPSRPPESTTEPMRATGTGGALPPVLPLAAAQRGHSESLPVILAADFGSKSSGIDERENPTKPTKKGLSEGNSDKPSESGRPAIGIS